MSEISGILKNGIDRGWQIEEIKQSLLNSGYSIKEIESEMAVFQAQPALSVEVRDENHEEKQNKQKLNSYRTAEISHDGKSSILIFIIILLFVLSLGLLAIFFIF